MGIFSEYRAVEVAGRNVWLMARQILTPVQGTIYLLCADGEPLGVFRHGAWPRSGEIVAEMRAATGEAVWIELSVRQWRGLHTQFELRVDGAVVEFPELSERALESLVPGLVERVRELLRDVVALENELPLPPRPPRRFELGKIPGEGVGRPRGIEPELLGTTPRAVALTGRGRWKRRGYAALMVLLLVFPSALIGPGVWHRERARQQGVATVGRVVDKTRLPENGQTRVDYAYTAEGREYRETTKDIDDALYARMAVGGPVEVRYVPGHGKWHHAAGLGEVQTARDLLAIKWLTGLGGGLGVFLFAVTRWDQGWNLRLARWGRAELPQPDDWEKSVQARVQEMFPFARASSDTRLVNPRRPSRNIRYRMLADVDFKERDRLRGEWLDAATRGDLAAVKEWLDRGVDVTCAHAGRTALLAAAEAGHADVAKALVDRGADGALELQAAVRCGCWAAADGLLRLGIRPGDVSTTTELPIDAREVLWSAVDGGAPVELLGRLVEAGCPVDATDEEGHTVLMLAVACEDLPMVEGLLRLGANTECCDAEGNDALRYARSFCSNPEPFLKALRDARRATAWRPEA